MQEKTTETETTETETTETETTENETTETETTETETTETEMTEIETAEAEITEVETAEAETAGTETAETKTPAAASQPGDQDNSANRGYFLKVVAGFYLIYTAYELADSYIKNEDGSSLGFCVAGIIFGLIGVFLLYIVVRDYLRENRQKADKPQPEAQASGDEGKSAGGTAQNIDNHRQM